MIVDIISCIHTARIRFLMSHPDLARRMPVRMGRRKPKRKGRSMSDTRLTQAPIGESLTIVGIDGGHAVRLRLATMGLREGTEIRVSHAASAGPVVVEVGGGRLVLGTGMAEKIVVAAARPQAAHGCEDGDGIGAARHGGRRLWAGLRVS
jgi:ferrous iron transport protein A